MQILRRYREWFVVLVLFVSAIFIWELILGTDVSGTPVLKVSFLDIGQGDSIYIESPTHKQVLIDGGPDRKVLARLSEVMPFYDKSIDAIVATHPDKDHVAGLSYVLDKYKVDYFLNPDTKGKTQTWQDLINKRDKLVESGALTKLFAKRGVVLDLGGGAYLKIIYPDKDVSNVKETNDASVVAELYYGKEKFLFTADAPSYIEGHLVDIDGQNLKVNVLKLGHHGSHTASSPIFLATTKPEYAIISAGLNNSYGHPHKEVLDLLNKFNIPYLETFKEGTITFKSDGETVTRY